MTDVDGGGQRHRILEIALGLMAVNGVDGTSMRDLAKATGLNVASLYHYFPSKSDLLIAVLDEQADLNSISPPSERGQSGPTGSTDALVEMLEGIFAAMTQIEPFIRLMLGEALRGDETAVSVGTEMFNNTRMALAEWLAQVDAAAGTHRDPEAMSRVLLAFVVGVIVEHLAGVHGEDDPVSFTQRARDIATMLATLDGAE